MDSINNKIDTEKKGTATRNTPQKEIVTETVLLSCDHPTAGTIYERAKQKMPAIGLATVYRCLNSLVKEGKVREITVPSLPSRFDKTTKIHAHFLCTVCGEVTDEKLDVTKTIEEGALENHNVIYEAEIIFKGICEKCCLKCGNTTK